MTANCTNLISTAIRLLESDAAFALRIQTSEPVLVGIARSSNDGVVSRASIALHRERERSDGLQTEACASVLGPYIFEQYTEPNSKQVQRSRRDGGSSTESTVEFDPRERDHSDSGLSVPDTFAMVCAPYSLEDELPDPALPRRAAKMQRRDASISSSSTPELAPEIAGPEPTPDPAGTPAGAPAASAAWSRRRSSRTLAVRPASTASTASCAELCAVAVATATATQCVSAATATATQCVSAATATATQCVSAAMATRPVVQSGGGEAGTEAGSVDVLEPLQWTSSTASSIDVELGVDLSVELLSIPPVPTAGRLHHPVLLLRREDQATAGGSPLLQRPVRLAEPEE